MDEVENNGPAEFCDTEEAATEERGFISKEIFHSTNTRGPGNCEIPTIYLTK